MATTAVVAAMVAAVNGARMTGSGTAVMTAIMAEVNGVGTTATTSPLWAAIHKLGFSRLNWLGCDPVTPGAITNEDT